MKMPAEFEGAASHWYLAHDDESRPDTIALVALAVREHRQGPTVVHFHHSDADECVVGCRLISLESNADA